MGTQPTTASARPKAQLTIRVDPEGRRRIAERAARADVEVSHMVRRMLAYADQHMPADWVPTSEGSTAA